MAAARGGTRRAAILLDEADWAQEGEPFDKPVCIAAYSGEGAMYVMPSEGEDGVTVAYIYAPGDPRADHDLLTALNSSWRD